MALAELATPCKLNVQICFGVQLRWFGNIISLAMTSPDEYSPDEYEVICRLSGGQTLFSSRFIVDVAFMKQAIRF
ncbi:hypothetical protein HZ326_0967 [Fusarium oxysporum f. sp. albedinis]|nr:hypothetical protein HZ326_0967 [Fusarium oxysporum f. sp. albedinis]